MQELVVLGGREDSSAWFDGEGNDVCELNILLLTDNALLHGKMIGIRFTVVDTVNHFSFFQARVRRNIPVTEFPEYVLHMIQEDEYDSNYLAREFLVTFAYCFIPSDYLQCYTANSKYSILSLRCGLSPSQHIFKQVQEHLPM